jgi:hypothetical protein
MTKRKILDGFLLCMKLLLPVLILLPLVFVSWRLVEVRLEDLANLGNEGYHSGTGLFLFAAHVLLLCTNGVLAGIGGICLFIVWRYKSSPKHRQNVRTFRWLTVAPAISQVLYVVVNILVLRIK